MTETLEINSIRIGNFSVDLFITEDGKLGITAEEKNPTSFFDPDVLDIVIQDFKNRKISVG